MQTADPMPSDELALHRLADDGAPDLSRPPAPPDKDADENELNEKDVDCR